MRDRADDLGLFAVDRHDVPPTMAYLLVRHDLFDAQHKRGNRIMAGEYRFHFLSRVLRDEIIDRVKDHRHVPRHLAQCREPRVIGEGIASDRPQQALRGFRAPCRNGQPHPPIGRSEHPPPEQSPSAGAAHCVAARG